MPVRFARVRIPCAWIRVGQCLSIAAAFVFIGNESLQNAVAEGDTRTLSFHHVHTGEDLTVTFKRNGRYDEAALGKLNWFMRDWRKEEETKMDPHLFDLLWEAYRDVGGKEPIQVVCGYRSPQTNAMLRARSSGVAQFSLHTQGDAMDFYIPGVPLEAVRNVGLKMQRGGVGFYPTSGSPFVHLDTGSIRHWPRVSRDTLVKLFPDGRTVHVPADGHPLPGYALALAEVTREGRAPSRVALASARDSGVIDNEETASIERRSGEMTGASDRAGDGNFLASMLGFDKPAEKPIENKSAPSRAPVMVASAAPAPVKVATETIVPMPKGRPVIVAAASPAPEPLVTSRGVWPAVEAGAALPAPVTPVAVADADPSSTAALAYANETLQPALSRPAPMGSSVAKVKSAPAKAAPVAAVAALGLRGGTMRDDVWMRATILTPSARSYLTATQFGDVDPRPLREFMRKPATSVVMSFAADANDELATERFSGKAVVFVTATTFAMRTAALQ